jgi:transposase
VTESALFAAALGIGEPVYIKEIAFDQANGELHIHMDFRKGAKFSCPECGQEGLFVRDTVEKTWRHLNFFQYKCFIHLRTPRVECPEHGVRLWVPPWGRTQSGFTLLFEAFVLCLAKDMPVARIAALVGETDTRIWRIVRGYVGRAHAAKDFSGVTRVGVDETSSRKGHNYVTVFADMSSGEALFATPGRDAGTVGLFSEELLRHAGLPGQIDEVTMDMSPAFIKGISDFFPDAGVTFDKFHVIQALNKAQDEVRRMESKKNPLLRGTRYIWLKNPDKLTEEQSKSLKSLSRENLRTAKVYQMKLTFQDIYRNIFDPESARAALGKWLSWAVRSRLEPVKRFAGMVKSHMDGILRYFQSRLTSGKMEGLNSRIQEIKRRAKGFRNIDNFIAMIYLEAGGLDLNVAYAKHDVAHSK